jgi:hypothetical protein
MLVGVGVSVFLKKKRLNISTSGQVGLICTSLMNKNRSYNKHIMAYYYVVTCITSNFEKGHSSLNFYMFLHCWPKTIVIIIYAYISD